VSKPVTATAVVVATAAPATKKKPAAGKKNSNKKTLPPPKKTEVITLEDDDDDYDYVVDKRITPPVRIGSGKPPRSALAPVVPSATDVTDPSVITTLMALHAAANQVYHRLL
jgi:hypothetical protein